MGDPDELNAVDHYAVLNVPCDASQEEVAKAYRKLAQVFHPDKHQDQSLKEGAQEAFGKLQEAYEVLSNVHKRQIYDIYGKQGLVAGFEVGDKLHSVDELKKEWEEFKRKREQEQEESSTVIKGMYQCRIDATDVLHRGLDVRSIVVTNSVDAMVGGTDNMHVQGQAAVRNHTGSGNIIFGYTRPLSPQDTLDGSLVLGLRSLLTLTSSRQLDPFTTAAVTGTWGPHDGLGLQLSSSRQLPHGCTGAFAWVVGPRRAAGMSLSLAHRRDKVSVQGKVEVGAVTSVSLRASLTLTSSITLRAVARLGSTGADLEVGTSKRFNPQMTGYLATVVGLQGIVVKVRVSRSNQTVEFPIIVSHYYDDWKLLVVATVAPPLVFLAASRLVVRPLLAWRRRVVERAAHEEFAEELAAGMRAAERERALLAPVARRKAAAEVGRGGLVVLEAVYGRIPAYRAQLAGEGVAGAAAAAAPERSELSLPPGSSRSGAAAEAGTSGGSTAAATSPVPWIRVTEALQYLVVDSRLQLHPGVSKVGLMGFMDPAPKGQDKQLYVAYWKGGTVREVVIEDIAGLVLGEGGVAEAGAEAGASGSAEAGPSRGPGQQGGIGRVGQAQGQAKEQQQQQQQRHEVVEEPARREWLLRQGAQRLGLSLEALGLS